MTRLRTKLVKNLTNQEAQKLRRLACGFPGGMREWFDWLREEADNIPWQFAPRVWWYEEDTGRVLAWGHAALLGQVEPVQRRLVR